MLGCPFVGVDAARRFSWLSIAVLACATASVSSQQSVSLPPGPLHYGAFTLKLDPGGAVSLEAQGWPTFNGTWKTLKDELTVSMPTAPSCPAPGRYRFRLDGTHLLLSLIDDACEPRRMILHDSTWLPEGEKQSFPTGESFAPATRGRQR